MVNSAQYQRALSADDFISSAEAALNTHQAGNDSVFADQLLDILNTAGASVGADDLRQVLSEMLGPDAVQPVLSDIEVPLAVARKAVQMFCPTNELAMSMGSADDVNSKGEMVANPKMKVSLFDRLSGLLRSYWGRCLPQHGSGSQVFAGGIKPTTRLVVIVAVLAFIIALAVAGTAVGLSWDAALKAEYKTLGDELDLVLNAAESFSARQLHKREEQSQYDTAKMLAKVIQEVGYRLDLTTVTKTLLGGAEVSAMMIDNLNDIVTKNSMAQMAQNLGATLDEFCGLGQLSSLSTVLNSLNQKRLPADHEAILFSRAGPDISAVHSLKFQASCFGSQPACNISLFQSDPVLRALRGESNSFFGLDYTRTAVYGGFTYLPQCQMGFIFQARLAGLQKVFVNQTVAAVNILNREYQGTTEIMVQRYDNPGVPLTTMKLTADCSWKGCGLDSAGAGAIGKLLNNQTGTAIDLDYRQTVNIISTATPLQSIPGHAFLYEIDVSEVVNNLMTPLRTASSSINANLNGTVELLLAHHVHVNNSDDAYEYLTTRRFTNECPSTGCLPEVAMKMAAVDRLSGVQTLTDYRGKSVLAAYASVEELDIGIVLKVDEDEIRQKSITQLTAYADNQNAGNPSDTRELMIGRTFSSGGPPVCLTSVKFPPSANEGVGVASYQQRANSFEPLGFALQNQKGTVSATDYRDKSVLAGYVYSSLLAVGFVLKVDQKQIEKPLVTQLIIVLFTAVGITVCGVLLIAFLAQKMLSTIEETWEKSKRVVQEQKESFENLVSALYPKFASDRLLSGDSQIVLELPEATIFFSDIVGFSTISNTLTAQELMGWIGYLFGVMDQVATYYCIYKVKTIGDAYFAMAGLPGLVPEGQPDEHSLRMLKFVSAIAQIFSGRYVHPDSGACLQMIAAHSTVMRKEKKDAMKRAAQAKSSISGASPSFVSDFSRQSSVSTANQANTGQCDMRFGVAAGPVTVGVLPGKCPAFDVWGKTVNLGSRMESTGRPNVIQCSERVFRSVSMIPDQPFKFDEPHNTFAKGFGNVPAYFVRSTKETPPKPLLASIGIEPFMDDFVFNVEGTANFGGRDRKPTKAGAAPASSLRHAAASIRFASNARNAALGSPPPAAALTLNKPETPLSARPVSGAPTATPSTTNEFSPVSSFHDEIPTVTSVLDDASSQPPPSISGRIRGSRPN